VNAVSRGIPGGLEPISNNVNMLAAPTGALRRFRLLAWRDPAARPASCRASCRRAHRRAHRFAMDYFSVPD